MTSSQSRMMMVPGPSKMLRAQLRMTPAPSKANTTRSRMTAAPSKITVTQSKMVPVPSIIRIPVEQSKTMTVVPSSQSVRTEAEYLSTNNHRPFVDSQGAIGIDPCKDGNYCNEPSLASIASGTNKHKGKPIKKLRVSLAGQKRQEKNHKGHYQVHLKKDDDVQETIEYKYNILIHTRTNQNIQNSNNFLISPLICQYRISKSSSSSHGISNDKHEGSSQRQTIYGYSFRKTYRRRSEVGG